MKKNLLILDKGITFYNEVTEYFKGISCQYQLFHFSDIESYRSFKSTNPEIILVQSDLVDQDNSYTFKFDDNQNSYSVLIGHTDDDIQSNFDDIIGVNFNIDAFSNCLKHAEKVLHLKKELNEEVNHLIQMSSKFLQARIPASYELLTKIVDKSTWIASNFKEVNKVALRNIEIAAYFCQAGRIFLPDELIELPVMRNGFPGHELMHQVPVAAKEIVSSFDRFEAVGNILYHIYENLDGSGIPERLQSWKIPLGSRIIRLVLDYEENIYFYHMSSKEVMDKLKARTNRLYDPRVVELLEQYILQHDESSHEKELQLMLSELRAGMKLSRDLKSGTGVMLLKAGHELNERTINTLVSHSSSDPILGYIFIEKEAKLNKE